MCRPALSLQPTEAPVLKSHPSNFDSLVSAARLRLAQHFRTPRIERDLQDAFCAYWDTIVEAHARRHASSPTSSLAGLFLSVALSEGVDIDDSILEGAAACEVYFLAVTLFDAIEDAELEAPWSDFPTAAVTNAALILFVLAMDGIGTIGMRTATPEVARCVIADRSLRSGSGQHRDVMGFEPKTLEDAVDVARAKTASIPMTFELAAIAAGCRADRLTQYGRIGSELALLRQAVNDLRDLFGKTVSTDLVAGKSNLVLASFRAQAAPEDLSRFEALRRDLPGSMSQLRELVFDSGALTALARVMEDARVGLHDAVQELDLGRTPLSAIVEHADQLVSTLYKPSSRP